MGDVSDPQSCTACGLVMGDPEQHALFHNSLKELRDVINQHTETIKMMANSLTGLAPLLYELAEGVGGPAPPEIAREIEQVLARLGER